MSDYISKSVFSEALNKSEKQPTRDSEDYIEGYCEGWNDVIDIRDSIPTVDEKEIIRKPFERVLQMLEHQKKQYNRRSLECEKNGNRFGSEKMYSKACSYDNAIEIVKEECGISE